MNRAQKNDVGMNYFQSLFICSEAAEINPSDRCFSNGCSFRHFQPANSTCEAG